MFEYNFEWSLSAKAQIILLLHLVCPVPCEILENIYIVKRNIEEFEKMDSLALNSFLKNKQDKYVNLKNQIKCLYPSYMYFENNDKRVKPLKSNDTDVSGVFVLNKIHQFLTVELRKTDPKRFIDVNNVYYVLTNHVHNFRITSRELNDLMRNYSWYNISVTVINKFNNFKIHISIPSTVFLRVMKSSDLPTFNVVLSTTIEKNSEVHRLL